MSSENILYENVVDVSRKYLGPAADRFITRQIRNHLNKDPEELTLKDLHELIDWIKLAMAFLTKDERLVLEYIESLQSLAVKTKTIKKMLTNGKRKSAPVH